MKPGIYYDLSNAEYQDVPAVSRSFLWRAHSQSFHHAVHGAYKSSPAFDFGTATHFAVLQPDEFEARVKRGPADRRGNKWKDAQEEGRLLMVSGEYDDVLRIRDTVHTNRVVHDLLTKGRPVAEASCFWVDERTGERCKVRPDLATDDGLIDLKTTVDASPAAFAAACAKYGYHMQDAFYRHGWEQAGGGKADRFFFVAVEKSPPYASAVYELDDIAKMVGAKIWRETLNAYAEHKAEGTFPSYGEDVQLLGLPDWAVRDHLEID